MEFKVFEGVKGLEARVNFLIMSFFLNAYFYFIFIGCQCEKSNIRSSEKIRKS